MMKVKIFMSSDLYFGRNTGCYLFGYTTETKESFTFYLLRSCNDDKNLNGSGQLVGEICDDNFCRTNVRKEGNFVQFDRGTENILLNQVFIDTNPDVSIETVQIILYDHNKWMEVSADYDLTRVINEDCIKCLSFFIYEEFTKSESLNGNQSKWNLKHLRIVISPLIPIFTMVNKLTVVKHMSDWYNCLNNGTNKKHKLWTIASDVLAGLVILLWLIYLGKPGQYFMQFTEFVVDNVRVLLNSLKGSPVGLKLNVELNNFFLNCFTYHVDLWATFLVLVSPAVQYLFIPLAIIGCLGLSFQLALLSDLLVLISVHAHCFYIYAAVLYHIEIVGIAALWRVLLGKRNNMLKNRIESHNYSNPQLYLATMFFATLLFILPTVLVYYYTTILLYASITSRCRFIPTK